jgi:hypothetical protein
MNFFYFGASCMLFLLFMCGILFDFAYCSGVCLTFIERSTSGTNPTAYLWGPRSKSEFCFIWTCPPKLAPEGIKPETLRGAHSKISSQPLGQPQMSLHI